MTKMLPIGSVVILKKGVKKLMITGYFQIDIDKKDKVYDYCGCLYPEGMIDKHVFLFNHNDINKIYFEGYNIDETKKFINKLEKLQSSNKNAKTLMEIREKNQ